VGLGRDRSERRSAEDIFIAGDDEIVGKVGMSAWELLEMNIFVDAGNLASEVTRESYDVKFFAISDSGGVGVHGFCKI
jgi:hypothetical protein